MHKTDRYFNKKKNGQHNFFGEEDYVEIKKGIIYNLDTIHNESTKDNDLTNEDDSG